MTPVKINTGQRGRRRGAPRAGRASFDINGRSLEEYFPTRVHRMVARRRCASPGEKDYDVIATIRGGGVSGQAGRSVSASPAR